MNCCDEYGDCRQGRDCPVRIAKYEKNKKFVELTNEEIKQVCYETFSYDPYVISRAIEAKLKEKNT